jgi:hypothetical protein
MSRDIWREYGIPSQKKAEDVPDTAGRSEELETSGKVSGRGACHSVSAQSKMYTCTCKYMFVMYSSAVGHNRLSRDRPERIAFFADRKSRAPARF